MRETITIKPTRGVRRRARRLAVRNPLTRVVVLSRACRPTYTAWVNEAHRMSAWIFYHPSGPRDDIWLRHCPAAPRGHIR